MRINKEAFRDIVMLSFCAILLKFGLTPLLSTHDNYATLVAISILSLGAIYALPKSASLIESATEILSQKTGLAAGLLQSLGTAFPDMILGITAAILSLQLLATDHDRAINLAIVAAATTFGSNIYNIGHAAWCIWRQNKADMIGKKILMFPFIVQGGMLSPLKLHHRKPSLLEIDTATRLLTILTVLTSFVALAMVAFGQVSFTLYQLVRPAGIILFLITSFVLYYYRSSVAHNAEADEAAATSPLPTNSSTLTTISLIVAGVTIAITAESMIHSLELIGELTHIPYVVMGTLAGIVGCLGEMLVIHNYSIHSNGRLGDALIGVAMDNIVTILGASLVAIMGGIFLGGTSLITLFVVILTLNTILIDQVSRLKTTIVEIDTT